MLSQFKLAAILICASLALIMAGGCADAVSGNPNITKANADNIQRGVTTHDQLVQTFGQPDDDTLNLDGTHRLTFVYVQTHVQPGWQTYIPIWDLFKSDADSTTVKRQLQTFINAEDICINYTYEENTISAHAGNRIAFQQPPIHPKIVALLC